MRMSIIFFMLAIIVITVGCAARTTSENQKQPLASLSGKYVFTIPIEKKTIDPQYIGTMVWKVTISSNGKTEYKDEGSAFIGTLNVYWAWDKYDRIWLYESDTGYVYFWEKINGKWQKSKWGYGHTREIVKSIEPPEKLYPAYAKNST